MLFFGSWFGEIGVGASVASPGDTAGFKVGVLGGGVGLLLAAPVNLLVALRVERPGVDTFARSSMATASGAFVVIAGIFLGIGTSKWIGHGGWIVFLAVMAVPTWR